MSNQIQRLRYFDGEYLRSFDFTDEQSYHLEMRRRLNHRLHLHGIVYGLKIVEDQTSTATDKFYSISPGMAIDQLGREIFVPGPYSLSSIFNRAKLQAGPNEVWICYQELETGLPAAGYRDCNATDQQTRWQEGFQVLLKPVNSTSVVIDCGGVRLGTVTLTKTLGAWQIVPGSPDAVGRTYVGIRAQRVIAADEEKDTFDITKQNIDPILRLPLPGYLDVKPSTLERGNLIVEDNIVVGDDFPLPGNLSPSPTNPAAGNLKVTSDLFLNGNLFGFVNGKWFGLKDYIQTLMPNMKTGTVPINIPAPTSLPATPPHSVTNTVPVSVTSDLAQVSNALVFAAISEIDWQDPKSLQSNWNNITDGLIVSVGAGFSAVANPLNLTLTWTVGPAVNDLSHAGQFLLPVTGITVSYVVIFLP